MELFEAIAANGTDYGDRPALIDDEGVVLWQHMAELVDRIALGLVHVGIRRGRCAAVLAGRTKAQALCSLGVMRGGGTAMPLIARLGEEAVCRTIEASRPRVLIYDEGFAKLAAVLKERYEWRGIVCLGRPQSDEVGWNALINTDIGGARFPVLHESAIMLHNYGIVPGGRVRAGCGSLQNLWSSALVANRGLKLKDGSRLMSVFTAGLHSHESWLRALRLAGTAVFCRSTHPEQVMAVVKEHKVDCLIAPTPYYAVLGRWLETNKRSFDGMRAMEARGRLSTGMAARLRHVFGQELLPSFSLPETFGPVVGSIPTGFGAPAAPMQPWSGVSTKLLGRDGADVTGYEVGELCLTGPSLAAMTIEPGSGPKEILTKERWFHTGQLARRHASGEIQFMGTRYEVLLKAGCRVYPRNGADLLEGVPGVIEAEGLLLEKGPGEFSLVLVAVMEPKLHLDEMAVMNQLSVTLNEEELPDRIVQLNNLPRQLDGAVDRARLQAAVMAILSPK